MLVPLKRHPDSIGGEAVRLEVDVSRRGGVLSLRYGVAGDVTDLRFPPTSRSERADELWRHTCFEAFVRASEGDVYYEFNFAPSTHWAAYRFTDYRAGMAPAEARPTVEGHVLADRFELGVHLGLNQLPGLREAPWRLAISAVLEDITGGISYWALAHPAGKPDFHHRDGFALALPLTDP